MSNVRENLIAAKALIDTPEKWGKGEYSPRPGCYCVLGALDAVCAGANGWAEQDLIDALRTELLIGRDIVAFNDADATTHADIMALFDRAIAAQAAA